jgi:hypothetical protein
MTVKVQDVCCMEDLHLKAASLALDLTQRRAVLQQFTLFAANALALCLLQVSL